jgi:hypothetical protein
MNPIEQAALVQLVRALQAHAREHNWQDVDEPIAALLAYPTAALTTPAPEAAPEGAPSNQQLAEWIRLFRLDVAVAGSRMPWATDWPLDRLMVEAADRISPRIASPEPTRDEVTDLYAEGVQTGLDLGRKLAAPGPTPEGREAEYQERCAEVEALAEQIDRMATRHEQAIRAAQQQVLREVLEKWRDTPNTFTFRDWLEAKLEAKP